MFKKERKKERFITFSPKNLFEFTIGEIFKNKKRGNFQSTCIIFNCLQVHK